MSVEHITIYLRYYHFDELLCHIQYPLLFLLHFHPLLGLGETNGVIANVVDRVPPAQESVTENGERAGGLGEVHAHKGRDARALDLEDVVKGGNGEVVASQGKRQVGQTVTLVTVNGVLTVEALLGANLLVPVALLAVIMAIGRETYRSSARVEGRAMREVPVSRMAPVLSRSAVASPKVMESSWTSQ